MRIYVTLRTIPPNVREKLRSKLALEGDEAAGFIADALVAQLDNESSMVVEPDKPKGFSHRVRGRWGVDEPYPCEDKQ